MAVTFTQNSAAVPGAFTSKNFTVTLSNSYPNPAGFVFTPKNFGFRGLTSVSAPLASTIGGAKYEVAIVPTFAGDLIKSFALHLVVSTTGSEVANAVDVSAASFLITVEGF